MIFFRAPDIVCRLRAVIRLRQLSLFLWTGSTLSVCFFGIGGVFCYRYVINARQTK